MRRTTSIVLVSVLFALAHFATCAFLSTADWPDGLLMRSTPRAGKVALAVLQLPVLFLAHDPLHSRAETLTWMGVNSAAAGLILALGLIWYRSTRSSSWRKSALAALIFALIASSAPAQGVRESTVGIPARITDLVLPGSEVEVLPQDAKTPVVLRITRVAPHGTDFRYDIEWTGLDVGRHDLRAFLRRKDGTDAANLPEIAVEVRTVLPSGMVKPNHPPEGDVPRFGGYRAWLIGLGAAWALGLAGILFLFRKKRVEDHAARVRPRTLAERLRPLVESAMAGTLSSTERAQLELGLVAYWRRRRGLETARPDEALAALRRDEDAGPLLNQLDAWLYKPGTAESVDLAQLLAPYKDLPPDALDTFVERS